MGAIPDTMMSTGNVTAWHGRGVVLEDESVTSDVALPAAGLDWTVTAAPLTYSTPNPLYDPPQPNKKAQAGDEKEIEKFEARLKAYEAETPEFIQMGYEGKFITSRSSDGAALGVVGARYNVFQNSEAFAFGDALVESSEAKWVTAGQLFGGSTVWMMMRVAEDVQIAGLEDETIEQYILIRNSHDGSSPVTVVPTPVRVVCQNTLNIAIEGAVRQYKVRHTHSMHDRIAEAQKVLGITLGYGEAVKEASERLLNVKLDRSDLNRLLDVVAPMPKSAEKAPKTVKKAIINAQGEAEIVERLDKRTLGTGAATRAQNKRDAIETLYTSASNLDNVRGTGYAFWQATSEYFDHHTGARKAQEGGNDPADNRFKRIIEGHEPVQKVFDALMTMA